MKSFKILLFIALTIGTLSLIAWLFPAEGLDVFGMKLRFPTLERIVAPRAVEQNVVAHMAEEQAAEEEARRRLSDLQDSVDYCLARMTSGDARFWFPEDNSDFFLPLMAQFCSAKEQERTIRIVHYGDSQIEMDRMSGKLRKYMQETFGGGGPGLIPLRTVISTPAVSLSASGSLRYLAPYGDSSVSRNDGHYGPLVHCHKLNGMATTTITASNSRYADSLVMEFCSLKLLFNNRYGPFYAKASSRLGETAEQCEDADGVQSMRWRFWLPVKRITLTMHGEADLYGMMVDNGPGVAVDNVPMRGCSGQQFSMINADELTAAYAQMDVGLIILQFGGNSVPYIRGEQTVTTYAESLGRQIDRLYRCCPNALILFIGPSDMCTTINGEAATYPYLPKIVDAIRDTVTAHGAAFWSLYDAMGGSGSMATWVRQGLAGSDHIHFTQRGADLMGDCLAESFDNVYHYFLLRRRMEMSQIMTNKPF